MHFAIPIVWHKQKDHFRNAYFCLTNVKDFFAKLTHCIQYLNLHSAIRPVPHGGFTIPNPPIDWTFGEEGEESFSDNGYGATTSTECRNPDFFPLMSTSHHLTTQQELNDLVRDVNLSQIQSELLASWQQWCNCYRMVLKWLNLRDDSVSLKSLSCPQKVLRIVMMQLACLEHCVGFIIQKNGGFLLTYRSRFIPQSPTWGQIWLQPSFFFDNYLVYLTITPNFVTLSQVSSRSA